MQVIVDALKAAWLVFTRALPPLMRCRGGERKRLREDYHRDPDAYRKKWGI